MRMFPSVVWKAQLRPEIAGPVNAAIMRRLGEIGAPLATLRPGESWQSHHRLHEAGECQRLIQAIAAAAAGVLAHLEIGAREVEITGCWANVSAPGARHGTHSHPNNFLSGVYYVQTSAGANTINFHDPRPQSGVMRPPIAKLTADNADLVVATVTDGTLMLFPAWLPHSVDANRSDTVRVSVSFNLMFPHYAETMGAPQWEGGRRRAT